MARRSVLLLPVDVEDASLEGPTYGIVLSNENEPDQVVRLPNANDNEAPLSVAISSETAAARTVPRDEARTGAPGHLLYKAVYAVYEGNIAHGQVTAYSNGEYSISTAMGTIQAPYDSVSEVAPVITALLWAAQLPPTLASAEALEGVHDSILDRLLGQNGRRATRAIPKLLNGVIGRTACPQPDSYIPWKSPADGADIDVRVGHVVDYAFYIDGNRRTPPSVRIGPNYYTEAPQSMQRHGAAHPEATRRRRIGQADPASAHTEDRVPTVVNVDDDAASTEERFADLLATISEPARPPKRQRVQESARPSPVEDESTRAILEALAPYPHLLTAYVKQLDQLQATGRPSKSMDTPPRASLLGISDLVTNDEPSDRQHGFRPSRSQQEVHRAITAADYAGKSPDTFMDHARNSSSTKFLPHPAVMSRLYDFQFGTCGISVLHFARFDLNAQLHLATSKHVNLRNYSPKLDLPAVNEQPTHHDLTEALAVLGAYAEELFDGPTRRFISTAREFGDELRDYGPWGTTDITGLAFWFSKVFASYRLAVVNDTATGEETRMSIRQRFCMQDAELNGILLKLSRGSHRKPMTEPGPHTMYTGDRATTTARARGVSSLENRRKHHKIPQEVLAQVPKLDGRQLCLRYVSAQGCASKTKGQCLQPYLAHFNPGRLPDDVRDYIAQNLGGLAAKTESQ